MRMLAQEQRYLEALPEEAEKSVLMVSNALAKNIGDCASKLTTLTEDLGLAVDSVSDARKELSKGFSELREQLKAQSYGTTAVTGAVSHQSAEIVKLLKAFDKFSHVGKWAMSGNETIENNVKAVREEIKTQGERLEQCLQGGFEEVSRHLKEFVRVMGTPEGIHMDTPETPERVEMGGFFPPNPPVNPPGMVGPTGTAAVSGAGLPGGTPPSMRMSAAPASGPPMPAAPASGHPLPAAPASGYPMHAGPVSGHPMPAGPVSGHPMPAAPASGHPMPAGVGAGLPPPPTLRTGIVTRDPGSGVLRTLSPHSLSWRPGFSHYGPVGPEWTRHAERRQAAVPPYLLEGQEWLEHSQRSSIECCERDPFPVLWMESRVCISCQFLAVCANRENSW